MTKIACIRKPAWVASALMLLIQAPAFAWDGFISAAISQLDVTGANNQGLRVYLKNTTLMCSGGVSWAYLNETDSNYKLYSAALLAAQAQGARVTVYSNLENGYCHIGYVSIVSN